MNFFGYDPGASYAAPAAPPKDPRLAIAAMARPATTATSSLASVIMPAAYGGMTFGAGGAASGKATGQGYTYTPAPAPPPSIVGTPKPINTPPAPVAGGRLVAAVQAAAPRPVASPATYANPSPTNTAAVAQRVPEYETAMKAAIEANMKRADEVEQSVKGWVNPYTQDSDAYKARVSFANNQVNRNMSGQAGRLRAMLAGRGQLGTASEAAAMAGLGAQHAGAISDAQLGLRSELDDKGTAFEGEKLGLLTRLASGDFSGAQAGYGGLLSAALGQFNRDRDFVYGADRDTTRDYESDREFDYRGGRDAAGDARWEKDFDYREKRDGIADAKDEREYRMRMQQAIDQGRITRAQADQAEWVSQNQGWLAAAAFVGNLLAGAGTAIGARG